MARVVKEYETRRGELIEAAWSLFMEHGYESTTVTAIIDRCGVSKGTFYHYFGSKEELLEASIERITVVIRGRIQEAINVEGLSAVEKMARLIDVSRTYKTEQAEMLGTLLPVIYSDENLLLRHKMNSRTVELIAPLFASVIRQGVEEGSFDVEFPEETAKMILRLGNVFAEENILSMLDLAENPASAGLLEKRIRVYATTIERVLGAPESSFAIVDERTTQLIRKMAEAANRRPSIPAGGNGAGAAEGRANGE